jgi:CDP-diacylglycerol--glycerol-3-phosphate 3-phosphatidyltransferase
MKSRNYYFVNAITAYRIIASPVLITIAVMGYIDIFKWLLPVSFFTDLIDGFLARKFKVTSIFGSKLDSIGDDLSFVAAIVGVFIFKLDFISYNLVIVCILLGLYLLQTIIALTKYGRITSLHTYMAKLATLFQGFFLIFLFLFPHPIYWLFYAAAIITVIDLIEEIIILFYLPNWEANVQGLYWVIRKRKLNKLNV